MIYLAIETANAPLSVAVVSDGKVIAELTQHNKTTHSIGAMPAVEQVLQMAKLTPADIDVIAVSEGPGSYTGVRIGVTIAKTLAWTLRKPLIGVSSLQALAANASLFGGLICPIVDARRQHVYTALYEGLTLEEIMVDTHESIDDLLIKLKAFARPVLFIGTDVDMYWEKIEQQLEHLAVRAPRVLDLPRASQIAAIAADKDMPSLEATHHFVPQYKRIAEAEANWIKEQKK
ncbi:tRNA (adenosine(37)-N6)-threonylcarbamoyltransferase complex dimerization subunit type 1 TsaB [Caryophanon tenue]|uniref:tRNA N6-adenosine(37)-N6-threonylcarbamoyltransferase complex dimerization subunit TsaB n=1 Tax=Caryophanon tenue TaxID=33978 RepID=A0A1C0Y5N7_9BACL|nr:tRNA (adenosine(37)-N6)-threonylcarbamoyltransferase complex dimerization subunit type 1 TsaB [Caryophanon tenue]OCS82453.1 tRNA N6-adenosine(37)-N6-threonylcarbamoyltransferase complex dimerization subunit TsaB [Caryophanon tenue]